MLLTAACGCSGHPDAPDRPTRTPGESGEKAVAQYDANSDGKLDESELSGCPGLAVALARVDADQDGSLTADEIAARIEYWETAPTTIINGDTEVTLDGQPLGGATVTFEPEDFLGEAFAACSGETDQNGRTSISGHDAEFPGIYLGFYRVRISKVADGQETIPSKYNTDTVLGYEASDDIPDISNIIQFELKSK
jgi:hypothetical protein